MEEKWKAFGWNVEIVDGHDHKELEQALTLLKNIKNKPTVLIARTKKGCGVPEFENNPEKFHCTNLTEEEYLSILKELDQLCNS